MQNKNKHIEKYLDFYCDSKKNLTFAVLLKGKWGSGKTYFIKKYTESTDNFLHISLYGLSINAEIDEKFFVALHPILSSDKTKLAIQALSGLIKFTTRIDFDDDGKDDFKLDSSGISKLNFKEFAKKSQNKVIIFDDVERCNIEIDKLMGYINHLVEFFNQKVIIVANEEKILNSKKFGKKYRKIKEKLIGKEFKVETSEEEAINDFVEGLKDKELIKNSRDIKRILLEIFSQSKYDNLRLIQQALSNFEYFFGTFSTKATNDSEIFQRIFYEFVIIFIEYKKGAIKSGDFFEKHPAFLKGILDKEESGGMFDEDKMGNILNKYDCFKNVIWLTCFNVATLGKVLQGIDLSEEERLKMIEKIERLGDINTESWQYLWHFYDNGDDDFFKNLKEVQEKWDKKEYLDFFVVLHVFGLFLGFSRDGFIEKSKEDILNEGKLYIEFLIDKKKFPLNLSERDSNFGWRGSFYGLGYSGMKCKEWQGLIDFIDKKINILRVDYIKQKIQNELLPVLRGEKNISGGLELFMNYNFLHINGEKEAYFQYLNVDKFVKILIEGDRVSLSIFKEIFEKRYGSMRDGIKKIDLEIPFLEKLKKGLKDEIKKIEKNIKIKKRQSPFY